MGISLREEVDVRRLHPNSLCQHFFLQRLDNSADSRTAAISCNEKKNIRFFWSLICRQSAKKRIRRQQFDDDEERPASRTLCQKSE